jgi:hypothetical protein
MNYANGLEVQIGDEIYVRTSGANVSGVVLKIIQPHTEDAEQWSSPDGGILVEGGGLGMFVTHSFSEDSDIMFFRRGE